MDAYVKLSKLHNLGRQVVKEELRRTTELRSKFWHAMPPQASTPPLPVPQDIVEEINLEHLTLDKHFTFEDTPPKP